MKNKIIILKKRFIKTLSTSSLCYLLGVGLLFLSCKNDLLDTAPYGSLASSNMWTTENLTDLGVAGVYQALRLGITTGSVSGRELYQFDRFVTSQHRGSDAYLTGTITTANGMFSGVWQEMYEGIHRANTAIDAIHNISPIAAEKKARLIAEMKFLRAYFYFRLNQVFKGVPIYLEPVTLDETVRPRDSESAVWQQILADLTDCINENNFPDRYAAGDGNYGHATKGAAYALRGKVYMYLQDWSNAESDFIQVEQAGYALFNDYAALFLEQNEQSPEMIFSIQHMPVNGFGSTTQFFLGTRSGFGSNWTEYSITPDAVDAYENVDGSPFNWDDVIPGYSTKSVAQREVYFFRNNLTETEINAAVNRGVDMSDYLPDGNEERIMQAYADRDPRLTANVITPYSTYFGREIEGADRWFTSRWPFRSENLPTLDILPDTRNFFYYLHRKFVYTGSNQLPNRTSGGIDFPIIRYADVLLMRAEAVNELGRTEEAVQLVNRVRIRAGVAALNSSAATMVAGPDDLRERIRRERRVEFIGEGISYFDELRWQTWRETVFYEGNGLKQIWGAVVVPYLWQGDHQYTWAVPLTEIQRNDAITQNPGWID